MVRVYHTLIPQTEACFKSEEKKERKARFGEWPGEDWGRSSRVAAQGLYNAKKVSQVHLMQYIFLCLQLLLIGKLSTWNRGLGKDRKESTVDQDQNREYVVSGYS
jgi:hypothetical protein